MSGARQDVEVGMLIDGAWVDAVTAGDGVLVRNPIQISRGRAKWSANVETARATFTMADRDGRWSPDYPTGPYAGLLKRNIPTRIGVRTGATYLGGTGAPDRLASTPDVIGAPSGPAVTPTVVSTTSSHSASFGTTQIIGMPATIANGDRLLLVAAFGHQSATHTADFNDWTVVYSNNLHTFHRWVVYELPITSAAHATAMQGLQLEFTSTTACRHSAQVLRVAGVRSGGIGVSWAASAGTGSQFSVNPDSPSLTAPWGANSNLFLSLFTAGSDGATVTGNPAGWTAVASGTAAAFVIVGSARLASTLATQNPGAFTLNNAENWDAVTFAYQPVESSSGDGVLDITGDIDVRIAFQLERDLVDFGAGGDLFRLAHKSSGANGWELELYREGTEVHALFLWYNSASQQFTSSTAATGQSLPLTFMHEPVALRFTLDVNNGSGGRTARWWTSASVDGPWTQLGPDVVVAGTTSIRGNDAPLKVGGNENDQLHIPLPGRIFAFQLRNGINGTVVANPNFVAQAPGATTFTCSAGRPWTIGAGGRLTNLQWRFHGELASLPVRWNTDGSDVWAPFEATGLFRRLRQGDRQLESAIRRAITRSAQGLIQYWPMEEQGDGFVTRFGAAVGSAAITTANGVPDTGANTQFLSSKALPTMGSASASVFVDDYTATDAWQTRWLQAIPADFTGNQLHFWRVETTDMVWEIAYRDTLGGQFQINAYRGFSTVWTSPWLAFAANGKAWRMTFSVRQNGANVDVNLLGQDQSGPTGGNLFPSAVAGSAGKANRIRINQALNVGSWAFGHVTVQDRVTSTAELAAQLNAHIGETSAARIVRLCAEEGIATRVEGDPATTEPMGPQRPGTLMDLLQECADTDLGLLFEARDNVAVAYRCRTATIGQPPSVALDYSEGEVAAPLELDRDDIDFANDVTVTNWSGTIARATIDTGPNGVEEPPVGAGRYDATFNVNGLDSRLGALATSRLALTSVDEPRVSSLKVAFNHPAIDASAALTASLLRCDLGDLVTVDNLLPVALGPLQVRLLVQGYRETIGTTEWNVDMLTSPASPWDDGEGGGITPPAAEHAVTFRAQQALATPGQPPHILTALGHPSPDVITRSQLDGILNTWRAANGGTLRTVTSAATWTTAMAAAQPGDLIRVTSSFTVSGSVSARGNRHGLSGATLTASLAGGEPGQPIIVTCADGVTVSGSSMTSLVPVLDLVNCRHVWAVGFNVMTPTQFGIRGANWGGSSGFPAYIAYNTVHQPRDASISVAGWFQPIASSGGTPPAGAGNEYGFSEWAVVEENTMTDPNPADVDGNPGEGVYLGRGSAPGWVSYAKDVWVRGNRVLNYKANAYEAKPGCHRCYFTDNLAVAGRGRFGAAFELCYQGAFLDNRPAWFPADAEIWVEGNRVYDYNITETNGSTRNQVFLLGIAGVRIANNLLWSARDSTYTGFTNLDAVLIQSEKPLATFGDATTVPTWVVNNNFQCDGFVNLGASGGGVISGIIFRNNIVPTGRTGGTHTANDAQYIAPTPAPGVLGVAEWETYGAGSAFDLDPGSGLVGAGVTVADLALAIDADISGRPIPPIPNPGPFQPFD